MAPPTSGLTISSHNVNGFSHSKDFLYSLCENYPNAIRGLQETWLAPPYKKTMGVNRLRCLHPNFDGHGNSAMKKDVQSKVRTGRPYGGTGFLFNKKHSSSIKPLVSYKHERVSVLKVSSNIGDIIMINGYLPYFNPRDILNQKILYQETLAYIENIIHDHVGCHFILLLDMNCNLYNVNHPFSVLINDLISGNGLFSAFDRMNNFDHTVNFTRCDYKTNSFTLIDGILLSKSLINYVSNVRISDYGDNVSDHRPVELDLNVKLCEVSVDKKKPVPTVNWGKLSSSSIETFRDNMTKKLDEIVIPFHSLLHGDKCCSNETHRQLIQSYYSDIESAVLFADALLPRTSPSLYKPYWTRSISDLKQKSIDCCRFWRMNGSPKNGPIFKCKIDCSFRYKHAIRIAKAKQQQSLNDDMYSNLMSLDNDAFWKNVRDLNKGNDSLVTRVDGETSQGGIAGAFRNHFRRVYSNHNTPAHESLKNEFDEKFSSYFRDHIDDSIGPCYLSWADMVEILGKLRVGKSSSGYIKPEHIIHGSDKLTFHLHLLFNALIQHGFVVSDFMTGTVTPIIKDAEGDVSDSANYRGITLGCLFSKLFDMAINLKIAPYLDSDSLQFGFKKKTSAAHALFTLKTTVNYFNDRGSNVFVAFMDCQKAFDRISHYGLFTKLIERKVPLCLLLIIIFWHLGMSCRVKWGDALSEEFAVPLGIKQGGISSPGFFSVYIDDMIGFLRKKGIGCHILRRFIGCLLFADDLALLSPSRKALQTMIDLCADYCNKHCLEFNPKKSKVMTFGKSWNEPIAPLTISGSPLEFVYEFKYLGTTIVSGRKFAFTARPDLSSFYRATNAVLNNFPGANPYTLITLLYTNCVPVLTYACSVKEYPASEMSDCNTAMNSAFRKIIGFSDYRSIRTLREVFGVKDLYVIFKESQDRFVTSCRIHPNPIVQFIATFY